MLGGSRAASLALLTVGTLLLAVLTVDAPTVRAAPEDYVDDCSNGIAVPDPEEHPGLVKDCAILLSARDTLAGDAPTLRDWSASTAVGKWRGVVLGGQPPRVTELRLRGLRLSGEIAPEIAELPALTSLDLRDNPLTGLIPETLGSQSALRRVRLGFSSGVIGCAPPALRDTDHDLCDARNPAVPCLPRVFCQPASTFTSGDERVVLGSYLIHPPGHEEFEVYSFDHDGWYISGTGSAPLVSEDPTLVRQHPLWRSPGVPSHWPLANCRVVNRVEGEFDGWQASYTDPDGAPAVTVSVHWRNERPLSVESRDDGTTYELRTLDGASAVIERPPPGEELPTVLRVFEEWTGVEYVVAAFDPALAADLDAMGAIARSLYIAPVAPTPATTGFGLIPIPAESGTGLLIPIPAESGTGLGPASRAVPVAVSVIAVASILGIAASLRRRV